MKIITLALKYLFKLLQFLLFDGNKKRPRLGFFHFSSFPFRARFLAAFPRFLWRRGHCDMAIKLGFTPFLCHTMGNRSQIQLIKNYSWWFCIENSRLRPKNYIHLTLYKAPSCRCLQLVLRLYDRGYIDTGCSPG